jgi:hypothetical protein
MMFDQDEAILEWDLREASDRYGIEDRTRVT